MLPCLLTWTGVVSSRRSRQNRTTDEAVRVRAACGGTAARARSSFYEAHLVPGNLPHHLQALRRLSQLRADIFLELRERAPPGERDQRGSPQSHDATVGSSERLRRFP